MNVISRAFKGPGVSIEGLERDSLWKSSMRYRIGKRFLALDSAGNPVLYYAYKKRVFGGWGPITFSDLGTPDATKPGGFALMLDKHPMHIKCAPLLEKYLQTLKDKQLVLDREWGETLKKRHEEIIKGFDNEDKEVAENVSPSSSSSSFSSSTSSAAPTQPPDINFRYELNKAIYNRRICRLNRFATFGYKSLYYGLLIAACYAALVIYLRFKYWLNPPARQGLTNIENSLLYYPRRFLWWFEDTVYYPFMELIDGERDGSDSHSVVVEALGNILRPMIDYLRDMYGALSGVAAIDAAERQYREEYLAVKKEREIQIKQSNRLKEILGFLFILFFVLLIL